MRIPLLKHDNVISISIPICSHFVLDVRCAYCVQRGGEYRGVRPAEAFYVAAVDSKQGRQASRVQHGQMSGICAARKAVEQCQLQSAFGGLSALQLDAVFFQQRFMSRRSQSRVLHYAAHQRQPALQPLEGQSQ